MVDVLLPQDVNRAMRDKIVACGGVPVVTDLFRTDAYNLLFTQLLSLLACAGGGANAGFSTVLYVDPNGNDGTAQRGSLVNRYQTIAAAIADAQAGDLILLAPGQFVADVVWPDFVNLQGSGEGVSVIVGTFTYNLTALGGGNFYMSGVTVTGLATINSTLVPQPNRFNAFINNVEFFANLQMVGRTGFNTDSVDMSNVLAANFDIQFFDGVIDQAITQLGSILLTLSTATTKFDITGSAMGAFAIAALSPAGAIVNMAGSTVNGNAAANGACTFTTTGCKIESVSINDTVIWLERGCEIPLLSIGGTSPNKRVFHQAFYADLVAGANAVALPISFAAGAFDDYNVTCVPVTVIDSMPTISGKTGTGFTATAGVGGAGTYEFGVFRQIFPPIVP